MHKGVCGGSKIFGSALLQPALRETQTLCAGCSKAEPKIFDPPQTPFPGAQDGQNLINWRGDGHYLHLQTQFGEDRCTQLRVIMITDPQTNKQTNKQTNTHTQTIHCAAKLSVQSNYAATTLNAVNQRHL